MISPDWYHYFKCLGTFKCSSLLGFAFRRWTIWEIQSFPNINPIIFRLFILKDDQIVTCYILNPFAMLVLWLLVFLHFPQSLITINFCRRLLDPDDELSDIQSDSVPLEVRDWLASTFTRKMGMMKKKSEKKPRFRSIVHDVQAGIFVER